jgi:hypothetical protein
MKKLIILGLLVGGTAFALNGRIRSASEVQPSSRAAPGASTDFHDAGHYLDLSELKGFRISVCSVAGTPLGSGTLRPYMLNPRTGKVSHASALSLTIADAGTACQNFADQEVIVPEGLLIYAADTVKLSDETGFSLVGLHLMTKELRHWVWVTVWWSPSDKANDDFGQDRPEEITKLGGPWGNYKMCVVTDFEEKDPAPRGGFEGTLGDSLAAVHGKATWCSNGFIEKGAHNAQTNCIGCHQHAGDLATLDKVLVDTAKFPEQGRTQVRKGFPMDYSWAVATPASADQKDRLLDVITSRMKVYAREDAQ